MSMDPKRKNRVRQVIAAGHLAKHATNSLRIDLLNVTGRNFDGKS